jgi:hypothetical protein
MPPTKVKLSPPTSADMVGVESDLLQLCATVSGNIYDAATKNAWTFEKKLKEIKEVKTAYPELKVRFFENGITTPFKIPEQLSFDPPSFTAIFTGKTEGPYTLILGWRGTSTACDLIADIAFGSTAPKGWKKGLEVQATYYEMIKAYFSNHESDILSYVTEYNKDKNGTIIKGEGDGTLVKRIILTGHSLGGGLAQVAHLFLDHLFLTKGISGVEIITVAFSAPMTTVLTERVEGTIDYLNKSVKPNMRNIVYNADVVPRGYAILEFIDDFLEAFENDEFASGGAALMLAKSFVRIADAIAKNEKWKTELEKYFHIGRLVYYANSSAEPVIYVDMKSGLHLKSDGKSFRDLIYIPKANVAVTALNNHLTLVTGPGLAYDGPGLDYP